MHKIAGPIFMCRRKTQDKGGSRKVARAVRTVARERVTRPSAPV